MELDNTLFDFCGGNVCRCRTDVSLQAGKQADEQMEEMSRRDKINEHGCDKGTV